MRRGRKYRQKYIPGHKRNLRKTAAVFTLMMMVMMVLLMWGIKIKVGPNLESIGSMRAKIMVSQIINKAVNNELYQTGGFHELLIRETDEGGKTELLRADTQAMNLLMTEISKELQKEFASRTEDVYSVPAGALIGDKILSQAGPAVDLRIIPLSVTNMDFQTQFESAGINQTKYRVYIDMTCDVRVLSPFAAETFKVSTDVLIAEAVILGSVPQSYVNVPEEDILDVTGE